MNFPYHIIDLSQVLCPSTPTWNGSCGFKHEIKLDYKDCKGEYKFRVQQMTLHAGIGTHMDAPAHYYEGAMTVGNLALSDLCSRCVKIDISKVANSSYSLLVEDILAFEEEYGQIPPNSFVVVYTGWDQYWNIPNRYHNNHKFPSVSEKAAELLLQRNIAGLGIDTLSPDRPQDGFLVHRLLLGNKKYIVENVANAQKLPASGAFSLALPLKAPDLTESPLRLVGLIEKKRTM